MFTKQTVRVCDVVEIPSSRMATATSRPPARDIRDTANPPRGFDQSAMLTSYRVWDYNHNTSGLGNITPALHSLTKLPASASHQLQWKCLNFSDFRTGCQNSRSHINMIVNYVAYYFTKMHHTESINGIIQIRYLLFHCFWIAMTSNSGYWLCFISCLWRYF